MKQSGIETEDSKIIRVTQNYFSEAEEAKRDRMETNKVNFDCFHMKADWSHKQEGQSKEFLPKLSMSVEQISSFFQQALVDMGDWFRVEKELGSKDVLISEKEVEAIVNRQIHNDKFMTFVGDSMKLGILGSLIITKCHGKYVEKPKYEFRVEKSIDGSGREVMVPKISRRKFYIWNVKNELIRQEDYFPDPTGKGLYELHQTFMDISELYELCEGEGAIYSRSDIDQLSADLAEEEVEKAKKARETNQNTTSTNYRKRVKVLEGWGTLIDPDTGKVLHKNCVWAIANDRMVIRKPEPNPFWHGKSPFVVSSIIRVPHSVWHRALADAPAKLNNAENELFNLILDAGFMDAHGIKQIRPDWLEDEGEISNGIPAGKTLKVNSNCPPGAKVLERVDTSSMSAESIQVLNITSSEFNQAALTTDLRQGVLPSRAVKATEVVESSNAITSVFTGISKVLEEDHIQRVLALDWQNCLQHMNDLDSDELKALLGEQRALELSALPAEARFAYCANGYRFRVFGVTQTLSKIKDFRKLTALLQTIGTSDLLIEAFMKENDMSKFLKEIMRSLDINTERIKLDDDQKMLMMSQQSGTPMAGVPGNPQSQIPQAGAGNLNEQNGPELPRDQFAKAPQ